jgi:peptide/nickel transport system permease protein
MMRFLARRVAFALLLVFVVSSGALLLVRLSPGDAASELVSQGAGMQAVARERARLGIDRPVLEQYASWLSHAVRLDFGQSIMYGRPVGELLAQRAANTALLAAASLLVATLVGIPLGVVSGSRRRGPLPTAIRAASLVCLSLPPLVTSLVLVFVAARTGWLPLGGMTSIDVSHAGWTTWAGDVARHLPLPVLALALPLAATLERMQSQATAEALAEPYIPAAIARGASRARVIWRDAFKPSLRPVASIYGLVVGGLLSGSFAVELVTGWPGIGRLMYDGLRSRDLFLVAGCAAAGSFFLAVGTLVSDVALAVVDPRSRETTR